MRKHGFNPWVRKILWKRKWQPAPVFLLEKSHRQRSLAGLQSMGLVKFLQMLRAAFRWLSVTLGPHGATVNILRVEIEKCDWNRRKRCRAQSLKEWHRISSVQFSRSVVSNSLRPHESQHARPPCPSPTPRVHSDSCPSSRWCHPAISSSVVPFSSCPQSLPASEFFPMIQLFAWGGQSTGVSALASFFPKKCQSWFPSECLVGSPCSPRDS